MEIIVALLGMVVGFVLGLTGAGGGILAIPLLMFSLSWTIQEASPVSMLAVTFSSIIGAISGLREGIVRYRAAIVIALASLPFSRLSLGWAQQIPQRYLIYLFVIILLISAYRVLRHNTNTTHTTLISLNPATGRFIWTSKTTFVFILIGILTGTLTGLLGVGGGFIIIPLLRHFTTLSMRSLAATSLMIVSLVSIGGLANVLSKGIHIDWTFAMMFSILMSLGLLIGKALANHLPDHKSQQFFSYLLIIIALMMLGKTF